MFENEIKFISDFSHNKLKKFGSFVTFEKLSSTDLHPAILSYISAELDYMIYRDRKKLLEDSIFDYSGREISDHFKIITSELKQNKKISISDAKKLIIQAVSFNINFVVRPKWSASKLIYNDQQFVSVDELEHMLKYLYYYDYIKNVLIAYISKRKVIQLTITEFDLILNKIDRELFKSNTEELINNALHSIGDFFNIGGIDKNRISLSAVEVFLKEKNLIDYLLKLRSTITNGSKKKYEIDDIKIVLYSTAPIKPESISGYDTVPEKADDESSGEEEIITEEEEIESKQQDADDNRDLEIVKDEKITSSDNVEEIIADEEEDLLPIEEELQQEFIVEETEEDVLQQEEHVIETKDDEEDLVSEQPEELNVEIVENEEPDSVTDPEDDELLSFYEQELNSMDDDLSGFDDVKTEAVESSELTDTRPDEEDELSESVTMEEEEIQIKDEIESEFNKDDFDLSVFEAEEDDESIDAILEKINGNDTLEDFSDDEIESFVVEEHPEDESLQDAAETTDEKDKTDDSSYDKRIIDEMLEDYFSTNSKNAEKSRDEIISEEVDIDELGDDEEEVLNVEDTIEMSAGGNKSEDESNLYDSKLASSILEGSSLEDDISNMINEIDELIEESNAVSKESENDSGLAKVSEEVEQLVEEENVEVRSDAENIERVEETSKAVTQKKFPLRQKDLLSYLTRKEVKKIISNVFGRDEEDFVTTIEKISELGSYKEATEILKGVFFTYRVSPYSKEAVILTNAVSHYFRQV